MTVEKVSHQMSQVYAIPALCGAFAYTAVVKWWNPDMVMEAIFLGTWVGMMARVVAINHFVVIPTFSSDWWAVIDCCSGRKLKPADLCFDEEACCCRCTSAAAAAAAADAASRRSALSGSGEAGF